MSVQSPDILSGRSEFILNIFLSTKDYRTYVDNLSKIYFFLFAYAGQFVWQKYQYGAHRAGKGLIIYCSANLPDKALAGTFLHKSVLTGAIRDSRESI